MVKTLLVHYLPRAERSNTKKLVDTLKKSIKGKGELHEVDLLQDVPPIFGKESISGYYTRNYMGQKPTDKEAAALKPFDKLAKQLKEADVVVVAYPMYNFSMPAAIKAWFDAVMLKGDTWTIGDNGFSGLMKGKKALILSTAGGEYSEKNKNLGWEHSVSLANVMFQFMGFSQIESISANGLNMMPQKQDEIIKQAQQKIEELVKKWY